MSVGKKLYVEVVGNVTGLVSQLGVGAAAVEDFGKRAAGGVTAYETSVKKASDTSKGFATVGKGLLVVGGLMAVGIGAAVKKYADFSAVMATNESLVRNQFKSTTALAGAMDQLTHSAMTSGTSIGYSATEVANAEQELIKAGISVHDIIGGALVGSLDLAAAGQEDVAEATKTAAIAMTQFSLQGKDVPHIADLLAAGADRALGSVGDLSQALIYGGSAAAQAGWSIEETVGTLAELANGGQMGSRAGMELQQMFRSLEKPSSAAIATMSKYGISVYQANGQMVTSTQLAGELHDKLGKLPEAEKNLAIATLFTSNAMRAANILMKDGAKVNADWITKVNAAGFASLQASGKMNSLSGDLQKLKASFDNALIGVGGTYGGPLRTMVQDLTGLIDAWNGLPGPVKQGLAVLALVATVVTLAGGAFLLAVPKIEAFNLAMAAMGKEGTTAGTAMSALGKAGAYAAVALVAYEGIKAAQKWSEPAAVSVDKLTQATLDLGKASTAANTPLLNAVAVYAKLGMGAGDLGTSTKNLDASLAGLVTSGNATQAATAYTDLAATLHQQGLSTQQIIALFPQYAAALSSSKTSAEEAGNGVDQYGNAVSSAAAAVKRATDAAKAYNDALKASTDPVFAMSSALQDLQTKHEAVSKAVQKYGADSHQAHQADLELAQSMVAAQGAATTLATAVKNGDVSMRSAKIMVDAFTKSMGLTKPEAQAVLGEFQGLLDKGAKLNTMRPHIEVSADTAQAKHALDSLLGQIAHISAPVVIHTGGLSGLLTGPTKKATGGLLTGPGTGTSDSIPIMASNGEFVMPADATKQNLGLLEAMRSGVVKGFAGGGPVGRVTQGNVLGQLAKAMSPGASSSALAAAVAAVNALATAWSNTIQEMQDAKEKAGLVSALAKAEKALKAAEAKSGKDAASGVTSAGQQVNEARKALNDFNEQQKQTGITNKINAALAKLQADEELADNKATYEYDAMTQKQQIAYLTKRMAGEKKYSDQWLSDEQERRSLIQSEQSDAAELASNKAEYQYDNMSQAQQLAYLDQKIAKEKKYSDEWMSDMQARQSLIASMQDEETTAEQNLQDLLQQRASIMADEASAQKTYAAAVADAMTQYQQQVNQILSERQQAIENFSSDSITAALVNTDQTGAEQTLRDLNLLTDAMKAYSDQADDITSATQTIEQQTEAITEWSAGLAALRAKGLSEDAIKALGLDSDPSKLAEVQSFSNATADQIAAMNKAIADKIAAAGAEVSTEQQNMYGDTGAQLLAAQQTFNDAISSAYDTLQAQLQDDQSQLAALGQDTGESIAAAIADGLASGIPGIVAAVNAVLAAMVPITGSASSGGSSLTAGNAGGILTGLSGVAVSGGGTAQNGAPVLRRGLGVFDSGGLWPSGTLGINMSGQSEWVYTGPEMKKLVSGGSSSGGAGIGSITLTVDARGAQEGVDVQITKALKSFVNDLAQAAGSGAGRYGP